MPSLPDPQIREIHTQVEDYHREKSLEFFRQQFIVDSTRSNIYFTKGPNGLNPDDIPDAEKLIITKLAGIDVELSSPKVTELKQILDARKAVHQNYPSFEQVISFTDQHLAASPCLLFFEKLNEFRKIGLCLSSSQGKQTSHIALLEDGTIKVTVKVPVTQILSHTHEAEEGKPLTFIAAGDDTYLGIEVIIQANGRYAVTDVKVPDLAQYQVGATLVEHIESETRVHEFHKTQQLHQLCDQAQSGHDGILVDESTNRALMQDQFVRSSPNKGVASFRGFICRNFGSFASRLGATPTTASPAQAVSPTDGSDSSSDTLSSFEDLGISLQHGRGMPPK